MKETFNSRSKVIYAKALEVAAEEVAFYQSKLEKSKELFSLCERLLGGLDEKRPIFYRKPISKDYDIKLDFNKGFEEAIKRAGGREKIEKEMAKQAAKSPIVSGIFPFMSQGGAFTTTELAEKTGLSKKSVQNWLCANKNMLEVELVPGQLVRKQYKLVKKNLPSAEKITAFDLIEKSVSSKPLSVKEITHVSGVSSATVFRWLRLNKKHIETGSKPCDGRKGWSTPTYKLK
jgi:hypothetical protein